jgi:hypothetical protein
MAVLAGLWGDVGDRVGDYVAVWRTAVQRNGDDDDDYAAADLLADVETLWGMAIGDAARVGAALLDAAGPLLAGFARPAADAADSPDESA